MKKDRTRMRLIDSQRDEFLRVLAHELPVPAQVMIEALNAHKRAERWARRTSSVFVTKPRRFCS